MKNFENKLFGGRLFAGRLFRGPRREQDGGADEPAWHSRRHATLDDEDDLIEVAVALILSGALDG